MSDKSLLSLREIAQELNLKYKTVLNLKNQLGSFMPAMYDGRSFRYYPDCIDLLRLINALREEGYTFVMIRDIFLQNQGVGNDSELVEWVQEWLSLYGQYWLEYASIDQHTPACASTNQPEPAQTRTDQHELGYTGANQLEPECPGVSQPKPEYAGLDKEELRQEIQSQVPDLIQDNLSELIAQLNSSITQFYKTVTELQEKVLDLDHRLRHLERELSGEPNGEMAITEMDLDQLQIGAPADSQDVADLKFVKASVGSNGKPDRDAISQWVAAERGKDPSVSYARLAEILDEAGVPTLSGREGWNRASLRNLVAKKTSR